jgi:hypothetical protein
MLFHISEVTGFNKLSHGRTAGRRVSAVVEWLEELVRKRIQPGRPQQNGHCEQRYRAPLRSDERVAPQSRTWSKVSTREGYKERESLRLTLEYLRSGAPRVEVQVA